MLKSKVMVLIATYNGEAYLEEQLDSILNQLDVTVSMVVSDDCSSDRTSDILSNIVELNKNVISLPKWSSGSAAKNFFRLLLDADFSDVHFVALSDQDDIWLKDKLIHAVTLINQHKADAYSSNVTAFWPDGSKKYINKAQAQCHWDYMFESAGPGCTFLLTQKLALEIQNFLIANQVQCKPVALHDWFIYAFSRSRGYKWIIDRESHMLYRQHAENVIGANVGLKAKLARWKKLRDGWLVGQALLIANILGYSNALPIQKLVRYNFADRLWLILNVAKLRRRLRDRVALVVFLLLPLKR